MSPTPLPPPLEELVSRVVAATGLDTAERKEVERDLRAHFEDGLAAGRPAQELARRFGSPEGAGRAMGEARRDRARRRGIDDGRWWMSADAWWRQVVRSARSLMRAPGFSAVVVLTLALGVGANTAVFSVLDAVLLQDLPYAEPGRLVRVYEAPSSSPGTEDVNFLRAPTVAAYRGWDRVFQDFGALYTYRERGADLTVEDQPVRITVTPATAGYFETLGVAPILGRTFTEAETFPPAAEEGRAFRESSVPVTVLGNRLWEEVFEADPDAVGRTIRLDGVTFEVVGVMPPGFDNPFGPGADAWIPQELTSNLENWGNYYLSGVARLPDGVSLEAAQERADALYARLAEANPDAGDWGPRLVPLHQDVVGSTRRSMLWILAGAAALVLLTACLNVANLVLARGLGRDRDVALRSALGSGRTRILAEILTENALLAAAGGALGLALGWSGVRGLMALAPDALPRTTPPELGASVFLFALAATVVALLGFALAPAWRMARTSPAEVLRSGDRAATSGRAARRVRDGLVVAQVAAALVLVAGATLLTRSFGEILSVPLTVEPEGVLTFEVSLPTARYPDGAARQAFHERFQERLAALPQVASAGAVSWLPLSGRYHIWGVYWNPAEPGAWGDDRESWHSSDMRFFTGDYFETVGLELLRGRGPSEVDLEADSVVWISRALAEGVFGDTDPVGQRLGAANALRRVAGVVEDVPVDARGRVTRHTYVPHAQHADDRNWALIQAVKARGDLADLRDRIRTELRSLDPELVLHRPRPLAGVVGTARAQDRFATVLMGTFALLALVLSVVGTYGVLAGSVAARRREIGIRMALGAEPGRVRGMVLRYAAALTLPGVVLGLAVAVAGSRILESLLFHVGSGDPVTYALAAGLFVAVGLLAGWLPARRATRVDTVQVLTPE